MPTSAASFSGVKSEMFKMKYFKTGLNALALGYKYNLYTNTPSSVEVWIIPRLSFSQRTTAPAMATEP